MKKMLFILFVLLFSCTRKVYLNENGEIIKETDSTGRELIESECGLVRVVVLKLEGHEYYYNSGNSTSYLAHSAECEKCDEEGRW